MRIKVVYTKNAWKSLKNLEKKDAIRIALKVEYYSKQSNPVKQAKKLKSPFDDLYRFRVGDYRVIFEVDTKGNLTILTILSIKHRKGAY